MKSSSPSPTVRVLALLLSLAAVGALLGLGLENVLHEHPDALPSLASDEALLMPPRQPMRSSEEEALLARTLSHFPPYPRASRPEPLVADFLGPASPIAVAWFSTPDAPNTVLEHYRQVLLEAGLPVIEQQLEAHAGYVGYWSPASEEVRLVSVLPQGEETLVFISAGQVGPLLEDPSHLPEALLSLHPREPFPLSIQESSP